MTSPLHAARKRAAAIVKELLSLGGDLAMLGSMDPRDAEHVEAHIVRRRRALADEIAEALRDAGYYDS